MTEIASPSSFLSGADLVPPGQRDPKPRSGSVPSVQFGSLVSEAAQNRPRPSLAPDDAPKPRDLPKAENERPVDPQNARDTDAPPPREKPAVLRRRKSLLPRPRVARMLARKQALPFMAALTRPRVTRAIRMAPAL